MSRIIGWRDSQRKRERENMGNNSGPSERVCTSRELARRQARGGNEVAGSIILVASYARCITVTRTLSHRSCRDDAEVTTAGMQKQGGRSERQARCTSSMTYFPFVSSPRRGCNVNAT